MECQFPCSCHSGSNIYNLFFPSPNLPVSLRLFDMNIGISPLPVSVVIPCFRCRLTIGRAIESVLSQTAKPFEVILIEDFSLDGTLEALLDIERCSFGVVKVIAMERNLGAACARNAGWAFATQHYVAFLDADDSWHPEKLRIQYSYMKMNTSVKLSGHRCVELDHIALPPPLAESWVANRISLGSLLFKNAFSTPTVMLVRDIPFRFQPGKRYAEDFLLWQQVAASGSQVARIELPLAYVHKPLYGSDGLSGQLWKMERGELAGFVTLYRTRVIGVVMCAATMLFSILKFGLRVISVQWMELKRTWTGVKGN